MRKSDDLSTTTLRVPLLCFRRLQYFKQKQVREQSSCEAKGTLSRSLSMKDSLITKKIRFDVRRPRSRMAFLSKFYISFSEMRGGRPTGAAGPKLRFLLHCILYHSICDQGSSRERANIAESYIACGVIQNPVISRRDTINIESHY